MPPHGRRAVPSAILPPGASREVDVAEAEDLRAACAEAARTGGAVLREKWGKTRTIELKGGIDLVTDADKASEAALLAFLATRYPGAAVLAEESGASGTGAGGLRFFVDPLDGTTNYARGGRAFLNGEPLRHSARTELRGALLVTGFPYDIHENHDEPLRLFGAFIRRARAVRRFGSAALDLAYVAAGRFDGFWELRLKPWDVAPGILIAREAGAGARGARRAAPAGEGRRAARPQRRTRSRSRGATRDRRTGPRPAPASGGAARWRGRSSR